MGLDLARRLPPLDVLVAEDNPVNQKVICALLQREGWKVTLTADGREACQRVLESRYDVVLMDIQMPEMDGFEATRFIRQTEKAAASACHTPILALTAHASREQHDQCIESGMDGVITKPVDPDRLTHLIGDAVASARRSTVFSARTQDPNGCFIGSPE